MDVRSVIFDQIDNISRYRSRVDGRVSGERQAGESEPHAVKKLTMAEIDEVVGKLNKTVQELNERISFSYHEKTDRVIVKVIDRDTNEVVREFPPREAIKLLEHLKDYVGMLVDESR